MKPSWVFAMALVAAIGWGAYILPFDWMQKAGLAGTVIGFIIGGLMIAVIGLSYGFYHSRTAACRFGVVGTASLRSWYRCSTYPVLHGGFLS